MRKLTLILICLISTLSIAGTQPLDKVIAIVNDTVITQSDVDRRFSVIQMQLSKQNLPLPTRSELSQQISERLIMEHAMLQKAQQLGIYVNDAMLDGALDQFLREQNLDLKDFSNSLNQMGMTFKQYREDFRAEIIIAELQQREIKNQLSVSEQEINHFLQSDEGLELSNAQYLLGHILITLPESPSADEIATQRTQANDIYAQLEQGANFAEVAIRYSQSPQALNGGSLGWRKLTEVPSLFSQPVTSLSKGEIAGPFQNVSGFHIIKLLDKHNQQNTSQPVISHLRHILIKPNLLTTDTEANEQLQLISALLQQGQTFEALAKEYSHDATSAVQGGDIGWRSADELPPQFRALANSLEVQEISPPTKTELGWQIVQLLERQTLASDNKDWELQAKNTLLNKKFEEKLLDWQRQLLDEAYVEKIS